MKKARRSEYVPEGTCVLCKRSDDSKERLGGIRVADGVSIHYFCALFASGLFQNGNRDTEGIWGFLLPDIMKEVKRSRRLTCAFCKSNGASIGCLVQSCRVAFHFPCGLENSVLNQYYGSFSSYCERHRPQQTIPKQKRRLSVAMDTCAICLCEVDSKPSDSVLLVPCCHNSYLHRECVQRQALSSGLHFFKCPLCNDKDRFTDEMLKFGIYIPDQDASWEREDNAFEELLERHSSCDVSVCLCNQGRDYNDRDSCWEIMLCDACGSQGTHLACSQLKTPTDDWMCSACNAVMKKFLKQKQKRERTRKREYALVTNSRNSSTVCAVREASSSRAESSEPGDETDEDVQQMSWKSTKNDDNSALSTAVSDEVSSTSLEVYKPRPRCLSRYIQRHKTGRHSVMDDRPRWVKILLNDDIHTGRNLGVKLSYMRTDTEEGREKDPAAAAGE